MFQPGKISTRKRLLRQHATTDKTANPSAPPYRPITIALGLSNEGLRNVKKIRARLSFSPSVSHEFPCNGMSAVAGEWLIGEKVSTHFKPIYKKKKATWLEYMNNSNNRNNVVLSRFARNSKRLFDSFYFCAIHRFHHRNEAKIHISHLYPHSLLQQPPVLHIAEGGGGGGRSAICFQRLQIFFSTLSLKVNFT